MMQEFLALHHPPGVLETCEDGPPFSQQQRQLRDGESKTTKEMRVMATPSSDDVCVVLTTPSSEDQSADQPHLPSADSGAASGITTVSPTYCTALRSVHALLCVIIVVCSIIFASTGGGDPWYTRLTATALLPFTLLAIFDLALEAWILCGCYQRRNPGKKPAQMFAMSMLFFGLWLVITVALSWTLFKFYIDSGKSLHFGLCVIVALCAIGCTCCQFALAVIYWRSRPQEPTVPIRNEQV